MNTELQTNRLFINQNTGKSALLTDQPGYQPLKPLITNRFIAICEKCSTAINEQRYLTRKAWVTRLICQCTCKVTVS